MKKMRKLLAIALSAALLLGALPGTALAAEEDSPRVVLAVENWNSKSLDLTEVGATDWIFPGRVRDTLPPNDAPTPQDRKADAAGNPVGLLEYNYLSDTKTWDHFWNTAGTSFSWSDGVNTAKASGQSTYTDLLRGFYGGNYADDNVGWKLSVPTSDQVQVLTLVTGSVWANVDLSVWVNGERVCGKQVGEAVKDGPGDGYFSKFTITVAPGAALEIKGEIRHTSTGPDMITLAGAGLSRVEKDPGADYVALLKETIDLANAWLSEDISDDVRSALTAELIPAQAALSGGDADEAYAANYFLSLVTAQAEATPMSGDFANTYAADQTRFFGWEGDANAPIVWVDGTYQLRDNKNALVTFGVRDLDAAAVSLSRAEGYLPCLVSEYSKSGLDHKVESFADEVSVSGRRFEVAYSRMTTTNTTEDAIKLLPVVSNNLIPLNAAAKTAKVAQPGESVVREYAIFADRFGGVYSYPAESVLADQGSYDEHYEHMKAHWDAKVAGMLELTALSSAYASVTDTHKAACVDLLIAADGTELRAGETGGDDVFAVDQATDILAYLVSLGYTKDFGSYAQTIISKAGGSLPKQLVWPFALYLQKTGDSLTAADFYPSLKAGTRQINAAGDETDILALSAYRYLSAALYDETQEAKYSAERDWAAELLGDSESVIWKDSLTGGADLDAYVSTLSAGANAAARADNARMLVDSFLTERADGVLVIGRGLPVALTAPGSEVAVSSFLCCGGYDLGLEMTCTEDSITVTITGGIPEKGAIVALAALKNNIAYASSGCEFDSAAGTVTLPTGVTTVTIGLGETDPDLQAAVAVMESIGAIGTVTKDSASAIQTARAKYNALSDEQKAMVTNYQTLVDAEAALSALTATSGGNVGTSSGGGGTVIVIQRPNTKTETNSDGSTTTTVTDPAQGTITETTKTLNGATVVKLTQKDGSVVKTTTNADKSSVESVSTPGEGVVVTAKDTSGKMVAKVEIPAELPTAEDFTDVPNDHWAKKGIDTVTALGLFQGTGNGAFSPSEDMTRSMLVTVLHRLSGEIESGKSVSFDDVSDGSWYTSAVAWGVENNIIQGNGAGQFVPDEALSREMLLTILYRFAGTLSLDTEADATALNDYSDKDAVAPWAADAMAWAAANGLTVDQAGALNANQSAPRAEVAHILTGFIGLLSK